MVSSSSAVLAFVPFACLLLHSTLYTHTHTHLYTHTRGKPTYYAIDYGTSDLSNNATRYDSERRPGNEPGSVEVSVDVSIDMTRRIDQSGLRKMLYL